jgi:hypothetical protein
MNRFRMAVAVLITISAASLTLAQETYQDVPQSVEALRQNAVSKTEFSLDHSMLVLASKLDSDNDELRRVIAGVSGLSVHRYRFAEPWSYDPEALRSVKDEFHAGGWKQLVNKHGGEGDPEMSDLWVYMRNNAVSDIAVLLARPSEVTFITISGSISPIDLIHLGGHFGIPKIEGGVVVPAPRR